MKPGVFFTIIFCFPCGIIVAITNMRVTYVGVLLFQ